MVLIRGYAGSGKTRFRILFDTFQAQLVTQYPGQYVVRRKFDEDTATESLSTLADAAGTKAAARSAYSDAASCLQKALEMNLQITRLVYVPGMILLSPYDTLLTLSILAVLFVDAGMPGLNDATEEVPIVLPDLLGAAEKSAQSWERLRFASGGALELSKCFAYIIYWDLQPSKPPRMLRPDEIPNCSPEGDHFRGPIGLTYGESSSVWHLLVTESPDRGRRTLGAQIAPSGNWTDEYNFRRKQGHELSLRMAGSSLAKETARLGYRTMVCPALEYPSTVTQFTQEQCDKIRSPILRSCMSRGV